jgi:methyl-accepting chemotaxis protein
MSLGIPLSTIVEVILAALLAPTLMYCVALERRLGQLRKDQQGLNETVQALNQGIGAAQASLMSLRAAAKEADQTLGVKVAGARALIDELSLLTSSADRMATRIESASDRKERARHGAPQLGEALRSVR